MPKKKINVQQKPCGPKTEEWLSSEDFRYTIRNGSVLGGQPKITGALLSLFRRKNHPDWIQMRQGPVHRIICIHRDHFDEFCKMFGFESNLVPQKTDEWVGLDELGEILKNGYRSREPIKKAMTDLYNSSNRPDWIQRRRSGNHSSIYIRRDRIVEFCSMYNFIIISNEQKTDEWFTTKELQGLVVGGKVVGGSLKITKALQAIYHSDKRPDWIQTRRSGVHTPICVHRDHVKDFCDLAGLKFRGDKTKKPTAKAEIRKFISYSLFRGRGE